MRGLLLKDWYAILTYLRTFLFMSALMVLMGAGTEGNAFLLYYPGILIGMTAMSLITYEEKEKWHIYAATLPYTKAQIVSSKYLLTCVLSAGITLLMVTVQSLRMVATKTFDVAALGEMGFTMLLIAVFPSALLLPFLYKFGTEKGRLFYYLGVGIMCGCISIVTTVDTVGTTSAIFTSPYMVGVIVFLLFALSWFLSVRFYQKRDLF